MSTLIFYDIMAISKRWRILLPCLVLLAANVQCQNRESFSDPTAAFMLLERRLIECEGLILCNYTLSDNPSVHCINKMQLCDGEMDCPGGMDEMNCERCEADEVICQDTFTCSKPCDNINECDTSEDEKGCPTKCPHGQLLCGDRQSCAKVCNRLAECSDGADEAGCPVRCPSGEVLCQNKQMCAKACDGNATCPNEEDESNCPFQCDCEPGQYICNLSERCIDGTGICEGPADSPATSCGTGEGDGDDEDPLATGTDCGS